jgi:hypothetical protein
MPEKYPSGKLIYGIAALATLLLIVMCAKPDPTPREHVARPEKSEVAECAEPMDSIECLEQHNLERRRERLVEQMRDEGLIKD